MTFNKQIKIIFLFFFLLNVSVSIAHAQADFSKKIINYWVKKDVQKVDGSRIYDEILLNSTFDLDFYAKDSMKIIYSGRVQQFRYRLVDSLLSFNGMMFKIKRLDDIGFEMDQLDASSDFLAYKFIYRPKKLNDLTFTPDSYLTKNGEIVYLNEPGLLEPQFYHKSLKAVDHIFENFQFPEFRKGGFVVRFVINTKGEVRGVRVVASSNDRYNARLEQAVLKTKGLWKPAIYRGQPVNVEVLYDYNLDFSNGNNRDLKADSLEYANSYFDYGTEFFGRKAYRQAESYYKKAIDFNPLLINAYFQRAACNVLLKKPELACEDYKQLIILGQVRAKELSEKYCKD
jgi:tetratricopeptide (TPR) repeat protein